VGRQRVSSLRPLGRAYLRRLQLGSNWPVPLFQHLRDLLQCRRALPRVAPCSSLSPASPSLSYLTQIVRPPLHRTWHELLLITDRSSPTNRCTVHIGILSHVISSPVSISYDAHTSSKRSQSVYESSSTSANLVAVVSNGRGHIYLL
jgi:hypothetical protein